MTGRRWAIAVLLVALTTACGGGGTTPAAAPGARADADPYAGFPPCGQAPPAASDAAAVKGLVLPAGATVQSSSVNGPLTTVNAYVEATPLAVRAELVQHPGAEVMHVEDEVFEAELLLDAEGRRSLVKAVAVCDKASRIMAVVSAGDAAALPAPGGAQP